MCLGDWVVIVLKRDCFFVVEVNFIYMVIVIVILGFGKNFFLLKDMLLLENIFILLYVWGNGVILMLIILLLFNFLEVFRMNSFECWLKGRWRVSKDVIGRLICVGVIGFVGGEGGIGCGDGEGFGIGGLVIGGFIDGGMGVGIGVGFNGRGGGLGIGWGLKFFGGYLDFVL